jgi:hypothetical protein
MNIDKPRINFKIRPEKFVYIFRIVLLCLILSSPLTIFAKSLAKYRGNIRNAKLSIVSLLSPDVEDESVQDFAVLERKTIAQIRADVPTSEKIEWQNATFETNNLWLSDKLDKFEKMSPDDTKRYDILTEISERLGAIEGKLYELENPSVSNRSKDENKRKLAEILRREEYQKPEPEQESFFHKIYRKIMDWIARIFPRPSIPDSSASGFQSLSFVLQMVLYAVVLGVIAFLIRRFAPFFANRFGAGIKREKKERVVLGERLAENETSENLFREAENLARAGNLRGAIRKGYIALLCELSERKIIGLSQHKTNRDYLRDVRKQNELYKNMSGLTDNYERHWYGFEDAEAKDWEEFRRDYQKAVNTNH